MKTSPAETSPVPRIIDSPHAWLKFIVIASLAAMFLTVWYEKAFPAIPALHWLQVETADRVLGATAICGSAAAAASLPLVLSSVRRWAGLCVQGLAVWGSMLLVAIGGDWTRRFALAVLLPWAGLAFMRCLTGPSSSVPARVAQGCGLAFGAGLSALLFVALREHEPTVYDQFPGALVGTSGRLTTWIVLVFGLLLLWSPALYFQGRAPSEIFRLGPVAQARDQTLSIVKWLCLLALSLSGGIVLKVTITDLPSRFWLPFCLTLHFAVPLALRGGWRGLAVTLGLALLVGSIDAVERATGALFGFYVAVVGLCVIGAVMGRVEWRQRLLRILGLLAGAIAFATVGAATKDEATALALGPFLCGCGLLVVDYIKLRDRAAEREAAAQQAAHWSPAFTRLVSTSRVAAVAVSLMAFAFAIPFVYVGSGIGRERPCWREYRQYGTPTRAANGCDVSPRPELILDSAAGIVISEELTGADRADLLFYALGTRADPDDREPHLHTHLDYLNQLSALEELEPCYQIGPSVSVNRGCAGYRVYDEAQEALFLSDLSKPSETRIARKLTAEEARKLATNPWLGRVDQERRRP